jgi:hypothetical protein
MRHSIRDSIRRSGHAVFLAHAAEAYASIRQHASAYVSMRHSIRDSIRRSGHAVLIAHAAVAYACDSIRQHTSAYVSIRQHESACVSMRQHTSAYVSMRQHASAYVMRPHTSAYVSIRQHTSAYVSIRQHAPTCSRTRMRRLRKRAGAASRTRGGTLSDLRAEGTPALNSALMEP